VIFLNFLQARLRSFIHDVKPLCRNKISELRKITSANH
jgi:hypothetical protein